MNPIAAAFTTVTITTLGRWAKGKGLTIDTVVGFVFLAIFLTVADQANPKLARAFGALVVVSVAIVHLPAILGKSGLAKSSTATSRTVASEPSRKRGAF